MGEYRHTLGDPLYGSPQWAINEVTKARYGRKILTWDGINVWFAREDYKTGIPVIYAPARMVERAIILDVVVFKECGECLKRALSRSDDYICINCRGDDPFLDDDKIIPTSNCPDCNGSGEWHECGRTQVCKCVDTLLS